MLTPPVNRPPPDTGDTHLPCPWTTPIPADPEPACRRPPSTGAGSQQPPAPRFGAFPVVIGGLAALTLAMLAVTAATAASAGWPALAVLAA
jgi:hypothetical protein